jgi:ubiquinone/menaquinone biosynthesis C-methylase UbiE
MNILRKIYIKTTNLTHGYQGNQPKLVSFYKLWAPLYDISIKLDPAYYKNLKKMINSTVSKSDYTLDIGCGTGLGSIYAATIAQKILGIDSSENMLYKLQKKIKKFNIHNLNLRKGFFPEALKPEEKFKSIITSFMLVHLNKDQQTKAIKFMFEILETAFLFPPDDNNCD